MPEETDLKPGDIVQLKTGGPMMTLECFLMGGKARCSWFQGTVPMTKEFYAAALVKA